MSNNCIYVELDGECMAVRHTQVLRRARKVYKCCECRDPIQPKDLYEYFTGLFDGHWLTYRTCARCVNVRTDFFRGWMFEGMVEYFENAHGFDYRDGIPENFTPCGQ